MIEYKTKLKLIDVDMLCKYCDNNINHSITPNEFMRMPFVDAEPVKHGRWLSHFEYCKLHNYSPSGTSVHFWCSRCETAAKEKTLYCPNCGAEMDGGEGQ